MSGAPAWRLVAHREIRQRMRSKAFVLSSVLLAAFVVAGVVLSAVLRDDRPDRLRVAVVERVAAAGAPPAAEVRDALPGIGDAIGIDVRARLVPLAEAERLVRDGDVDVALDGARAIGKDGVDEVELAVLQAAVQTVERAVRAEQLGLSPESLRALLAPVTITTVALEPRAADQDVRTGTAAVGLVLLFLAVQLHGAAVLMGVVEEKSSRVVEVLLGHVRPRSLLLGKVVGIGVAGLAQVVVVAGAALGALVAVSSVDAPKVPASAVVWFVLWFVLGFALYATVFASLGSLVSRQEDAQSVVTPATIPLLLSYFIGFAAVQAPASSVARWASIVPFSSPMVMPVRLAASDPPWWEVALSLASIVVTIAAVLRLGARLYERNVLRTGLPLGAKGIITSLRNR